MRKTIALALALVALVTARGQAQLPIHLSVNAGAAIPVRNDADVLKTGLHLGAGAKIALIPFQIEGAIDRFGSKQTGFDNLTVTSFGVSFPFGITPPLLPVSVYVLAGGGLYHMSQDSDIGKFSATKFGLNAGAGVRLGIGLKIFAEGRGHIVFAENNKLTYGTIGLGLRL